MLYPQDTCVAEGQNTRLAIAWSRVRTVLSECFLLLLQEFKNHDFMYEAAPGELSHYMDRSNFPKDHKYFDNSRRGES